MKRRHFVNGTMAASVLAVTGIGLSPARRAHAARPDAAFLSKDPNEILNMVFGTSDTETSGDVKVEAPLQAENGAVVPVQVTVGLPDVELVGIVVNNNPTPLLTVLEPSPRGGSYYSLRVKMAGTDTVHAYVKAGGKLYVASQEVRVAVGGCGG